MTCIDFVFTRSKVEVKVARVLYVKKMVSAQFLENFLSQGYYISLADWSK